MPAIPPPPTAEIEGMLGTALPTWQAVEKYLLENYAPQTLWGTGGKAARYEYKFRKGGKTICALYPKQGQFGFLVVLGRAEQEAFEANSDRFAENTRTLYHETRAYHDGRWLMLWMEDDRYLEDAKALLTIKRRPKPPAK